jgi:hypothetical protein
MEGGFVMKITENVQFLIVGNSHDHILKIVSHFKPHKVVLISSSGIMESTTELVRKVQGLGLEIEIVSVDPFKEDAVYIIMHEIISRARNYTARPDPPKVYIGFTGGTNLMAIAAALSALVLRAEGHYVVKDTDEIIILDPVRIVESARLA